MDKIKEAVRGIRNVRTEMNVAPSRKASVYVVSPKEDIRAIFTPEVKHWHGATKDEWFTHVALEIPAEGASNEWCEPVSDEQYNAL